MEAEVEKVHRVSLEEARDTPRLLHLPQQVHHFRAGLLPHLLPEEHHPLVLRMHPSTSARDYKCSIIHNDLIA